MNDPHVYPRNEPQRGTWMLGPAVPPRDSGNEPRGGVIDGAAGPFLARDPQAPPPVREPGARADAPAAEGGEWGEEIIASGVLGGGEVVPIESLAPHQERADAGGAESGGAGFAPTGDEEMVGDAAVREREAEMAEPAGVSDEGAGEVDTAWASEEEAYPGYAEDDEGGWEAERGGEPRPEPGEAEVGRAAGSAPEPGGGMSSMDAAGDEGATYAGGGAGFGEDPYWEPWVEPSGADAAAGADEAATAWEAAAVGGEGYAGQAASAAADEQSGAGAANLATPLLNEAIPGASSAVLQEIAERLERIARSLRSRDGDDVGGDASDPLEVLITGYALGYSEGVKSVGGSQRDEP